jgi:predicted nucleic acid-binding protein
MKEIKAFLDTNILVYAYDLSAGGKHLSARKIVMDLWETGTGVISTQVLQEFFVTVTRKIAKPISPLKAQMIVADLLKWKVVVITGDVILDAIAIQAKNKFTFSDSMIVAAATTENCETLYSEDLPDGQLLDGVRIKNPFSVQP